MPRFEQGVDIHALVEELQGLREVVDAHEKRLARRKRPIVARVLTVAGVVFAASALGFGALTAAGVDALRIDAEGQVHILETITIGGAATINGAATVTGIVSAGGVTTGGAVAADKVTASAVNATDVTSNSANLGKLTVTAGSTFSGGRNYFEDQEAAGKLRVGAAWGVPGIYAEDGKNIVVGSAGTVQLGKTGKFATVDSAGNVSVAGNFSVAGNSNRALYAIANVGNTQPISAKNLAKYCGDGDGCEVRLSFHNYNNTGQAPASRVFTLFCDATCKTWRTSHDISGTDFNNKREDLFKVWDCYFSDDIWSNSQQRNDNASGFGLMLWHSGSWNSAKSRSCHLAILD